MNERCVSDFLQALDHIRPRKPRPVPNNHREIFRPANQAKGTINPNSSCEFKMKTDDSELPETSNSAPVPTLSDIPLLPRRRLRDGTTSQSNSSRRGSRASTVGSSSSIASSRSSSSSSWRGSSSTKRDGSVKPRRGVQRLRGGGVGGAGGGSKETAVEVGDSDEDDDDDGDIIEVYASYVLLLEFKM